MFVAKPYSTPITKDTKLSLDQNKSAHEEGVYRHAIGRLLYLTNTRPNINFAVQFLSQFVQSLNIHHHQVVNRVLRYVKGSLTRGLFFLSESNMKLNAFSDSDWA